MHELFHNDYNKCIRNALGLRSTGTGKCDRVLVRTIDSKSIKDVRRANLPASVACLVAQTLPLLLWQKFCTERVKTIAKLASLKRKTWAGIEKKGEVKKNAGKRIGLRRFAKTSTLREEDSARPYPRWPKDTGNPRRLDVKTRLNSLR